MNTWKDEVHFEGATANLVKCCMCDATFFEYEDEPLFSCIECGKEEYLMDLGVVEV
jgi:protein-arginine kinase activator protein McsA